MCACDLIFQNKDANLRELLNVKPKCKIEDKANATEAICNYIRLVYFYHRQRGQCMICYWHKCNFNILDK